MEKRNTQNYIKKIAEAGSISVAAEQLGISQPALSAYLKKVENELDAVLFDRNRQPLELTEAGVVYMEYLEKQSVLQKELTQNLADIESLDTGDVTVGGASFFNIAYLPGAVAKFASDYPGVNIEIIDGKVPELVTTAQKGNLDLFITPVADEPDRFCYEELLKEKIFLAVPEDWEINEIIKDKAVNAAGGLPKSGNFEDVPLLNAEEFSALCRNTFIVLKADQDLGRRMESLFEKFGCRPARVITAEQTMTTLNLTQNGVGVSMITESSIRNCGLAKLPMLYMIDPEMCTRKMYIAYPRNRYISRAAKKFITALKESN